jgi:hypothetical protein
MLHPSARSMLRGTCTTSGASRRITGSNCERSAIGQVLEQGRGRGRFDARLGRAARHRAVDGRRQHWAYYQAAAAAGHNGAICEGVAALLASS